MHSNNLLTNPSQTLQQFAKQPISPTFDQQKYPYINKTYPVQLTQQFSLKICFKMK